MSVENPYAAPLADLSQSAADQPMFFVVAPRKLLLMILLSQGLYMVYWSYKQWAYYRQATGARIWPWARGFFAVFFFYSFAMKVRRKLELTNTSHRWWPRCLALGLTFSALLPQAYVWFVAPMTALKLNFCLMIVDAALAVQLQHAVNRVEDDAGGEANHRLTWANGIWILIGMSTWALTVFWTLNPPGPY
jgi:hypothetical protein